MRPNYDPVGTAQTIRAKGIPYLGFNITWANSLSLKSLRSKREYLYKLSILCHIHLNALLFSVLNFDSRDFLSITAESTWSFYLPFSIRKSILQQSPTVPFSGRWMFLERGLMRRSRTGVDACHVQNNQRGSSTSVPLVSRSMTSLVIRDQLHQAVLCWQIP